MCFVCTIILFFIYLFFWFSVITSKSDIKITVLFFFFFFFGLKERGKVMWIMFKNEIENRKKLELNRTFEFIDWDKNYDKQKKFEI